MNRFDYVISKIQSAPMRADPFRHIYIEDLFSPEDFSAITQSEEIAIPAATDDAALFDELTGAGYKIIDFPGCITDKEQYLEWHRAKERGAPQAHSACEGFGMTLRLVDPASDVLTELRDFLAGPEFNAALADRFGVDLAECTIDGGIQKYLDGYEISPHPDIRRKAATFMVNINPHANAENLKHHTSYMRLKPEYAYVRQFWGDRAEVDRCWVPWDWCDTVDTQPKNNSIVLFSPANDTMHAVKADYDHLQGQRTQLYGNLWYRTMPPLKRVEWEGLAGGSISSIEIPAEKRSVKQAVGGLLPKSVKKAIRDVLPGKDAAKEAADPNYYRRDVP